MITVKSNISEFLKNYRKRVGNFKNTLNVLAEKLAQRMSQDMAYEITSKKFVWVEEGNLSLVSAVDFDIEHIGDNAVRVTIGDNLGVIGMNDGTLVNPLYFIEFGFGIVGKNKPMQGHSEKGWEYDIKDHGEKGWYFYDNYGELVHTQGREGINFLYNTIQDYRNNWRQYLKELMTEIGNG
jgi:hypothetical protein